MCPTASKCGHLNLTSAVFAWLLYGLQVVRIATKRQKIAFPKTVVKITIVEAEELSNLQLLDLLDPFVRLEHARGEYQTQVSEMVPTF
jgi:hypothetical protein